MRRGFATIVILLGIVVIATFAGGYYLGKSKFFKPPYTTQSSADQTKQSVPPTNIYDFPYGEFKNRCSKYGFVRKQDFLPNYVVKPGDTLLSITKSQLNDPSRINELIELNKDEYPGLSIDDPFLEQGWVLVLPPEFLPELDGSIMKLNAEITNIHNNNWALQAPNLYTMITPGKNTIYTASTSFRVGDCVTVIYGIHGDGSEEIYQVSPQ